MPNLTANIGLKKPLGNETADIEIINQNMDTIDQKIKENADSIGSKANASHTHTIVDTTGLQTALDGKLSTTHSTDMTAHDEIANIYRSSKDSNGIYTVIDYRRTDGTLFKKSTLSGGTSPKYTTRTVIYYANNGTTVLVTKIYTLTYTGDDLTSEVTT